MGLPIVIVAIIGIILVLFLVGGGSFSGTIASLSHKQIAEIPCSTPESCNSIYKIPISDVQCQN